MKYIVFFLVGLFCAIPALMVSAQADSVRRLSVAADSVVCITEVPLTKAQPECTLGNLLADNLLAAAQELDGSVQAAVLNQASIGMDYISPGPVTRSMLDELFPYNNKLVILEVKGSVLTALCNHIAQKGGWPVSGLAFGILEKEAVNITINNQPVHENTVYKIAANDYIAYGKNGCDFFKECSKNNTRLLIKKMLVKRLRKLHESGQVIDIQLTGRITYID